MSSDRQRRALSERVHDLESTVARLEAEKNNSNSSANPWSTN